MSRKKMTDDIKRNKSISVKYSQRECRIISEKANENGMKLRTFIREASLTAISEQMPKIRLESLAQLRKAGVNLNQITKNINTISKMNLKFDPKVISNNLNEAIAEIRNTISHLIIK